MAGKRIPDLDPLSGAASANDDKLVIYDASTTSTKRIDRSQLAAGIVGDLPYTPSGSISATTIPTAIAELDSEVATKPAVLADIVALRAVTWPAGRPSIANLVSNYTAGDGGGVFRWDSASTATDNGGTIIKETATTTGRWLRQFSAPVLAIWFGANTASSDSTAALVAALGAGSHIELPAGVINITELSGSALWANKIIEGPATTLRRINGATAPANASRAVIDLSGAKNFTLSLFTVDGNGVNQTVSAQNIAGVGCGNVNIQIKNILNPKAVGGSFGAGFVFVDSTDFTDGTHSIIGDCEANALAGGGTYGVQIVRCRNLTMGSLVGKGWANALRSVADFTIPVPANPTNGYLNIGETYCLGGGIGFEMFGYRSGVSADSFDIFAEQFVTEFCQIGPIFARDCTVYGAAIQADGVQVSGVTIVDCGTVGQLTGGLLWQSRGGTASHVTIVRPKGIGIDMGGSAFTGLLAWEVIPSNDTQIALNAGAALSPRIRNGRIRGGASTAILISGYDGANSSNWFPWLGRDAVLRDLDIDLTRNGDVGIKLSNGYQGADLRNITFHQKHATVTPLDIKSCDRVERGNVIVINETNADPAQWTSRVSIASTGAMVIPDHPEQVSVTGTTTINTIARTSENAMFQKVRHIPAVFGANGSGYTVASGVSITGGGGSGATAIPVRSDQKIYGAYVVAEGSGYTSAPTASLTGPGTGASLIANVGAPERGQGKLLLRFANASALTSGAGGFGEMYLTAAFTPSAFGISTMELVENTTNWLEVGR